MPIELEIIDWSKPALPEAARWIAERFSEARNLDLSEVLVCLPGAQARRRMLELLIEESAERGLLLAPPEIVTPGHLPELLYEAKHPFASGLTQQLAWVKVLQGTEPGQLVPLVRHLPDSEDWPAWLALGQMLSDLHRELSADGLDCLAVLKEGANCAGFNETERWKLLAELQRRYLRLLDGLQVWDMQTARLYAIAHRECRTDQRILLVGLVDLNRVQRQMLDQVAQRVTALVFAPVGGTTVTDCAPPHPGPLPRRGEGADAGFAVLSSDGALARGTALFDEHGCLRPEKWQDVVLPLTDEQIEMADGPADQADAVVRALAALDGQFAAEDIVVGVPDKRLAPYLRQRLNESNLPARDAGGIPLACTGPCQLLVDAADYLEKRRFNDLATLVRHPALAQWLRAQSLDPDWLTMLDQFYARHLPAQVSDKWPSKTRAREDMRRMQGAVTGLLKDLRGSKKPIQAWAQPILELLSAVYGNEPLDESLEPDRTNIRACAKVRDVLKTHLEIDKGLSPSMSGAGAIRLLLRELETETIPPHADFEAIEMLGWLELIWNDAPALLVCGFNEGLISPSVGHDPFLPNTLRQRLQLDDNERRFARDAYALGLIAASRQRLHIVAGRRSAQNDPLTPSRLLFTCRDGELARRTMRLFASGGESNRRILLPRSVRPGRDRSNLPVPLPDSLPVEVTAFNVTEFKDYLACPYRYYLRHRLELEALADTASELDSGQFGSLLHDALRKFGSSPAKDSTNPEEIRDQLYVALGELAAAQFGTASQPAVQVQIELVKMRLEAFAERQAEWRKEGWQIRHVEEVFDGERAPLTVDGRPAFLHGRIDRIDCDEATGRWAVLDYKSTETARDPDKTHRDSGGWIDLQLPLYRHLVRALGIADNVQLGYVQLPKDVRKTGFALAAWTPDELRAADDAAAEIIRQIWRGRFWPPTSVAPAFFEDYAAICQDARFGDAGAAEIEAEDEIA